MKADQVPTDTYDWADSSINACPRYATGFTQLLATQPYRVSAVVRGLYDSRLLLIRAFQNTSVDIFRAALRNELDPAVLHWLMNETRPGLAISYHCALEDRHFTLPVFFRTDEVRPGRIIEINCPAALWGELQLAYEYAVRTCCCSGDLSPAEQYVTQLADFLHDAPVVHHFLDKSSAPGSWRYFIEKTRPRVKYWGIDRGVRVADCNFIRYQAFVDVLGDGNLPARLSKVGQGVTFDFPPHVLFDQKAALVLPFWSITRMWFGDDIRGLFPFTAPLLPTGIELPDGTCTSIEDFSRWPRSRRSYYLKYAGADWTVNYGSKAVYRLSNMSSNACLDFLRRCLREYERGQIWLLQQEETQDDKIEYLTRDGELHADCLRANFGGFYGPGGCLGVLAMHSRRNKVHGREDTVISYVLADAEGPVTA
jgi:hypothetical protein